ncbi:MAG: hypothetical protein KF689_07525 [Gemmatimonadaceae bacterium]|nr:hypothetical protein [Gemmatimonadaceae bacterium]MCW5824980.1 hypothetical protein [Gemmatimonadaceae bacterium]
MRHLVIAFAALTLAAPLSAQGSVGTQGLGYPLGGLSGAAAGLAGANAEIDPNSAVNPAALTRSNRFSVMLRFEPEFRDTRVGSLGSNASVMRFPAFQATGAYGKFVGSVGVTTMLDRTWRNQIFDSVLVDGTLYRSRLQSGSEGAVSDARIALGYVVSQKLQVGLALHSLVGENRTLYSRTFDDTTGIIGIGQNNSFGYGGSALSFGVTAEPISGLVLAGSARVGQEMRLELEGSELSTATVPGRVGIGVTYFGIPGFTMYARLDQTRWSDLEGLASDSVSVFDATEISLGAEALGPKLFGANTVFRAGLRDRTLPFGVNGSAVTERGFAVGIGLPLSRGRSQIDIGGQRMARRTPGASETAWLFSLGFGIRP